MSMGWVEAYGENGGVPFSPTPRIWRRWVNKFHVWFCHTFG